MKTKSNLERVLEAGHFAVTAELSPPASADFEVIKRKANLLEGYVDAVNVTDGQSAVVAMASWAACLISKQEGLDSVVQMTCRDRNRIALQMDILGIAAFGVNNILCLTGESILFGNHPQAKAVNDLDSVQLVQMVKNLRDEKRFQNGELIQGKEPCLFIGAAANPFSDTLEHEVTRLAEKVEAGVDFIQTQSIYNIDRFETWMKMVRDKALHNKVKILAGITPLKSVAAARHMKAGMGLDIPEELIERLHKIPKREQVLREAIKIAVETIERLRKIEGVAGVHIMPLEWEEAVPEVCKASGLYPRPLLE